MTSLILGVSSGALRLGELLASGPDSHPIKLNPSQLDDLQRALLNAFPDIMKLKVKLAYMLRDGAKLINESLEPDVAVFRLIQWAKSTGRLEALIRAAYKGNSGEC